MQSFVFFLVAFVSFHILARASDDPVNNFCKRWAHQSTFKNGKIYIDGGLETFTDWNNNGGPSSSPTLGYNVDLLVLDMTQDWSWRAEGFAKDKYSQYSKNAGTLAGTILPILERGSLSAGRPDDNGIYLYGGRVSPMNQSFLGYQAPSSAAYTMWRFDTIQKRWTEYSSSSMFGHNAGIPNAGAHAQATELGLNFYIHGQVDQGSSMETQSLGLISFPVDGMVVVNTTDGTARNLSTVTLSHTQQRTRGGAVQIYSLGLQGTIITIGGVLQSLQGDNDTITGDLLPMDTVDLFNINNLFNGTHSSEWYHQTVTGDIPEPRIDFCLTSVSASDNSSHHVYLYGGRNASTFFDDVYVLSLPAFVWTKVSSGSSPRAFHTCHVVAGSQVLTIGGANDTIFTRGCDWETQGVAIYNLNTGVWGSMYNATYTPYHLPPGITAITGGNTMGNATVTRPVGGFTDPRVAALFTQKRIEPQSTGSNTSTGESSSFHWTKTDTIIITTILGGTFTVAVIAWSCWHYGYKTRMRRHPTNQPPASIIKDEEARQL